MIGPIRQEILSGIPDKLQYETLRLKVQAFDDIPLQRDPFERAAALALTDSRAPQPAFRRRFSRCSHPESIFRRKVEHHGAFWRQIIAVEAKP